MSQFDLIQQQLDQLEAQIAELLAQIPGATQMLRIPGLGLSTVAVLGRSRRPVVIHKLAPDSQAGRTELEGKRFRNTQGSDHHHQTRAVTAAGSALTRCVLHGGDEPRVQAATQALQDSCG